MVDVRNDYPRFQQAGGEVVVITMGSPSQVARFRERLKLSFACLSDQSQDAYRAYSVPRGSVAQIAGPRTWRAGLQALWRGGLGIPQGDPYQLHAAFVVDQQGLTRFAHRPETSSDLPNHDDMFAAIRLLDGWKRARCRMTAIAWHGSEMYDPSRRQMVAGR